MSQQNGDKESFTLYEPLPRKLQKDKSLVQIPKDAKQFVTSFLRAAVPRKRSEKLEKLSSRKEMVMDAVKPRWRAERRQRQRRGRKKRALSNRQRKELDMNNVPTELQKYEMYEPLHQLWLDYMRDSLQLKHPTLTAEHLHIKLLRCDLHGSILTVTKSKCPSYIGQSGIVVQESRNAFKMITKADVLKTIPKANTIFTMSVDNMVVTIYGNHLRFRAADRANRKFKVKPTIDL